MLSKLAIFSSALLLMLLPPAQGQTADTIFPYTLQVASFPDPAFAAKYADRLSQAGESVGFGMVELFGRGQWTRVFVGSFKTPTEARLHGEALIARRLINEYIVKTSRELESLARPHRVNRALPATTARPPQVATVGATPGDLANPAPSLETASRLAAALSHPVLTAETRVALRPAAGDRVSRLLYHQPEMNRQLAGLLAPLHVTAVPLPVADDLRLRLAPAIETEKIPRPDPTYLAFNLISENRSGRGGLWVSGDRAEALARLRYIVGDEPELIDLEDGGAVRIDRRLLARAAGATQVAADVAPMRIAEYIAANEGLLLLVQLTQGPHRYLLHIGSRAPALGGSIEVPGGLNLDNNYDSRINPYRRDFRKLDVERPPKGFDSMVAINPAARWFNLRANDFVEAGQITFHELAEAHAKVVFKLDYLQQDSHPGAHDVALEREERLKAQRPSAYVVLTVGANRLFKTEKELQLFYTQTGHGAAPQR